MPAATRHPHAEPPSFLPLAAPPVRWRVLSELGRSDRRVAELCSALELPQSLVSYHLGRLRAAGVVSRRRSAADGRDSYYALELERCRELLTGAGAALHPGLRLAAAVAAVPAAPAAPRAAAVAAPRTPTRVLFLCTGNSARSQIAEALAEKLGGVALEARSAGSHPKALHPNAVRVMRERGVDISAQRAKHLSQFAGQRFAYVITLCDRVREVCPEFPGHPEAIHWSIPDPARAGRDDDESYPAFERTAAELATRIAFLVELIAAAPGRR